MANGQARIHREDGSILLIMAAYTVLVLPADFVGAWYCRTRQASMRLIDTQVTSQRLRFQVASKTALSIPSVFYCGLFLVQG